MSNYIPTYLRVLPDLEMLARLPFTLDFVGENSQSTLAVRLATWLLLLETTVFTIENR